MKVVGYKYSADGNERKLSSARSSGELKEKAQLHHDETYHNTKLSYDLAPQKESPFYLVDYQLSVAPKSKSSIKLTVKIHLAVDRYFL